MAVVVSVCNIAAVGCGRCSVGVEMAVVLDVACGARYKTRPGLTYHLSHSHSKPPPFDDELNLPMPSTSAAADGQSLSVCVRVRARRCRCRARD